MKNSNQISLAAARVILGFVIASHGVQKLFGWFGGYGFDGTMGFFTGTIGLPYVVALLIILAESLGMVALMLGLFSRFFAASVVPIMLGAIFTMHIQNGYYMNWNSTAAGEGYEFHVLAIGLALVVAVQGGGAYALDSVVTGLLRKQKAVETIA